VQPLRNAMANGAAAATRFLDRPIAQVKHMVSVSAIGQVSNSFKRPELVACARSALPPKTGQAAVEPIERESGCRTAIRGGKLTDGCWAGITKKQTSSSRDH
jgi:hypothetical protein